jgi:hypothetical protein
MYLKLIKRFKLSVKATSTLVLLTIGRKTTNHKFNTTSPVSRSQIPIVLFYLLMVLQMLVDFVNFELFPSPEVLSADVARVHLKVNLAVVVVELVCTREGHVTCLALLFGVVVIDMILVFSITS